MERRKEKEKIKKVEQRKEKQKEIMKKKSFLSIYWKFLERKKKSA